MMARDSQRTIPVLGSLIAVCFGKRDSAYCSLLMPSPICWTSFVGPNEQAKLTRRTSVGVDVSKRRFLQLGRDPDGNGLERQGELGEDNGDLESL